MLSTVEEVRNWSRQCRQGEKSVGFVPTMGALHDGHLRLVLSANEQCDATLVSIFVNPSQFGPNEDFDKYPRTLENDLSLLRNTGSPAVFCPMDSLVYPTDFGTFVDVDGVSSPFEGAIRPGHFRGVATVVLKFLMMVLPDKLYLGQKDFQQVCVLKKMIADLNVPVEAIVCPTVREPDGLAMSSRNQYLSAEERKQAVVLSQALVLAEKMITSEHCRDVTVIRQALISRIRQMPAASIDYAAIADPKTLQEIEILDPQKTPEVVVLLAVRIGTTRLIDNCLCRCR